MQAWVRSAGEGTRLEAEKGSFGLLVSWLDFPEILNYQTGVGERLNLELFPAFCLAVCV